jgi:hypothetical protein
MQCIIVTPERTVFDRPAEFVALTLFDGELGVAPGHAPMIGRLGFGEMRIRSRERFMRILDECQICLIACLALSLAGCHHDDKASSPKAAGQRDAISVPVTTVYSGGGVTIQRVLDDDNGYNGYLLSYKPGCAIEIRGELFSILGSVTPEMLHNETVFPKGGYAVYVEPPKKEMNEEELKKRAWRLMVPAYEKAFNVNIHHVSRTEEVFVLQIHDSGLCNVEKAKESDSWGWGTSSHGYEFRKHTFGELSDFLRKELDEFVLDETKDKAIYKYEVPVNVFDTGNPDVWIAGLKTIGLKLQKVNRKLELTVIEKTSPAAQPAPHH